MCPYFKNLKFSYSCFQACLQDNRQSFFIEFVISYWSARQHSLLFAISQDSHHSSVPIILHSRKQSWLQAVTLSFFHPCNPAVKIAGLSAFRNAINLSSLMEFLPTFKSKEIIIFNQFYGFGGVWHSKAMFVLVMSCNTLISRSLLCKMIFINRFMQSISQKWTLNRTASSRFSLLNLIRPEGRIFVFIRTRQVVFWGTRNRVSASKQLALPGA